MLGLGGLIFKPIESNSPGWPWPSSVNVSPWKFSRQVALLIGPWKAPTFTPSTALETICSITAQKFCQLPRILFGLCIIRKHFLHCCHPFFGSFLVLFLAPSRIPLYPFNRLLSAAQIVSSSSAVTIIIVIVFIHRIPNRSGLLGAMFHFLLSAFVCWLCLKVFNKLSERKWSELEDMVFRH